MVAFSEKSPILREFLFDSDNSEVVAYAICIQNEDQEVANVELPIGAGMGPDLMARNDEQNFRQLHQLIEDTIETDESAIDWLKFH